jgi:hypothetical protein
VFWRTCTACGGLGDPACAVCSGDREPVYRCPASHATHEINAALTALDWVEAGVMPVAGGLLEQSATFVQFASIVASERAAIDREERARNERRKEMGHGRQ